VIKKLEVLTNVAVIITAVVLYSVLVRKYLTSKSEPPRASATSQSTPRIPSRKTRPEVGSKLSLDGIDWTKSERTVLLALSTKCGFCTESAPFYQQIEQQKPSKVRLVAVLPQPVADGKSYLAGLNVKIDEVAQAALASIQVSGTPTLLLVDKNGVVENLWVGKLSERDSQAVLLQIAQSK